MPGTPAARPSAGRFLWALLVNSAGLLADGYDLLVVDAVMAVLSEMHPESVGPPQKSFMASMTYAGIIAGMVLFGMMADMLGHKIASLVTSALCTIGCVLAACCVHSASFSIAYQLGLCRFLLGLGIGGEYPVSMTLGSGSKKGNVFQEAGFQLAPVQILSMNIVFFSVGGVLASVVGSCLWLINMPMGYVWRILIILGSLPSVSAFLARTRLADPLVEASVEDRKDAALEYGATNAAGSVRGRLRSIQRRYRVLVGCCLAWALHNFVFFGSGSFRSLMNERMFGGEYTARVQLARDARFGLFMALIQLLGSVLVACFVTKVSLFWAQVASFAAFSFFAGLCSLFLGPVNVPDPMLFAFTCIWMLPLTAAGVFCYVTPTLNFPAHVHATCCGIAAAAAKAGACIGTALFPIITQTSGMSTLLLVCCLVGLAGLAVSAILLPKHVPDLSELMPCKLATG